jgi:hypothetical protein
MKSQADGYDDPTLLVGGENEKDLARARKMLGSEWVVKVKRRWVVPIYEQLSSALFLCT